MRAQEFIPEYETGTPHSREIQRTLRQAGYQKLGGGVEATAWARDDGRVIKIIMPGGTDASTAQRTFQNFYRMTQRYPSPHWPVFYEMQDETGHRSTFSRFRIQGQPYMQIAMERLHPLTARDKRIVNTMVDHMDDGWDQVEFVLQDRVPSFAYRIPQDQQAQLKSFLRTLKIARDNARRLGYAFDLHTGNVMKRGDGTLVITDPWIDWN